MTTLVDITDTIGTTIETTNLKASTVSTSPVLMITSSSTNPYTTAANTKAVKIYNTAVIITSTAVRNLYITITTVANTVSSIPTTTIRTTVHVDNSADTSGKLPSS